MTTFRSEDVLVGLVAGALVPWIGWTLSRGLNDGRLPMGRTYVRRDERAGPFWVLFAFYTAAAGLAAMICLDLLLGVEL